MKLWKETARKNCNVHHVELQQELYSHLDNLLVSRMTLYLPREKNSRYFPLKLGVIYDQDLDCAGDDRRDRYRRGTEI